jgi:hypothetical protein
VLALISYTSAMKAFQTQCGDFIDYLTFVIHRRPDNLCSLTKYKIHPVALHDHEVGHGAEEVGAAGCAYL